jgi:hypothetical protein|tara:strand:- start:76 stop:717 length:642 start_codon:yes stop_codon:yes gene_type:complete
VDLDRAVQLIEGDDGEEYEGEYLEAWRYLEDGDLVWHNNPATSLTAEDVDRLADYCDQYYEERGGYPRHWEDGATGMLYGWRVILRNYIDHREWAEDRLPYRSRRAHTLNEDSKRGSSCEAGPYGQGEPTLADHVLWMGEGELLESLRRAGMISGAWLSGRIDPSLEEDYIVARIWSELAEAYYRRSGKPLEWKEVEYASLENKWTEALSEGS